MISRNKVFLPACLIIILFSGCESDQQEFEAEPNIFAVMVIRSTGYSNQFVFIDKTYSIVDSVSHNTTDTTIWPYQDAMDFDGVEGCEVAIYRDGDDGIAFIEDTDESRKGVYSHSISFNDTTPYQLNVVLPDGDTVKGESYIPSPFQIYWPYDSDTLSMSEIADDTTTLFWSSSANIKDYLVCIKSSWYFLFPVFYWTEGFFTGDTSCNLFSVKDWGVIIDTFFPHEIVILGMTPEYEQYLDPRNPGKGNLSNAYGVFTGISVSQKEFYVRE